MRSLLSSFFVAAVLISQQGCRQEYAEKPQPAQEPSQIAQLQTAKPKIDGGWTSLFDGYSLGEWKATDDDNKNAVHVENGLMILEKGNAMTAAVWTGEVQKSNYEISLEGKRLEGDDFFCTTTFPVGDSPCSLVVGGWGGELVGLSSIDGLDAAENSTSTQYSFEPNRWYRVRIRVTDEAVEAWINDNSVVFVERKDHKFSIRVECNDCRPLGICSWNTKSAVRNIKVRAIKGK